MMDPIKKILGNTKEENVAGWKLEELGNGRVRDITTGRVGKLLKSSGYSWKDVEYDED